MTSRKMYDCGKLGLWKRSKYWRNEKQCSCSLSSLRAPQLPWISEPGHENKRYTEGAFINEGDGAEGVQIPSGSNWETIEDGSTESQTWVSCGDRPDVEVVLVNSDWTEDREIWKLDLMRHYEVAYDAKGKDAQRQAQRTRHYRVKVDMVTNARSRRLDFEWHWCGRVFFLWSVGVGAVSAIRQGSLCVLCTVPLRILLVQVLGVEAAQRNLHKAFLCSTIMGRPSPSEHVIPWPHRRSVRV